MSKEDAASSSSAAASSSNAGAAQAAADGSKTVAATGGYTGGAIQSADAAKARGVDLITGPDGDLLGFSVSPSAQLYNFIDQLLASPRLLALPVAQRYSLAGKVAAVPDEFPRIVEKLASHVATSQTEVSALNALYVIDACKELVPGFKEAIPEDRLDAAAKLSPHSRVQAVVLNGEKPAEWEKALKSPAAPAVMILPQDLLSGEDDDLEDKGLVYDVGRTVGDGAKLVSGAALGGVGMISDTLGITRNAEGELADTAEEAVDIVGDGLNAVVDTVDEGIDGTARDFKQKGVVGAVGDGAADAVDMISDFVGDAVNGIAGGVHGILDWVDGKARPSTTIATHKVAIVVAELFGDERSLGLRIENRVITKFTKPEAEKLGWKLGDCIIGVGSSLTASQDEMLAAIGAGKEAMKSSGTPLRFLVERLGERRSAGQPAPRSAA
eukprot:TRINITY_DN5112_c0_g1_i1.p1 TRINITY_DN5112_c0_g1~~TRINITY_DN5112_c0_g1_i1.p1  ORF type:complete len:467 (-),score=141.00 TRINITY_DN5112_c0_g1_i1:399-1718(-)